MLHNLRKKINLAVDGRWFPSGIEFIEQAKGQRYYAEGFPWVDVAEPFSPKNSRRILLSRPTTSQPRSARNPTHAEPIRPPDPVTSAFIALHVGRGADVTDIGCRHSRQQASKCGRR